ncbi:MAG TPA: hypothetical protein QGI59_00870 [Candidatus Poseidoniia archaeon]|nr:hypothetical protein [Candidatus Poseidoniia archaeon]|tara:strand:- start:1893 stop:2090 length:198 start_codon:yes stop_codon:yes gene_type:complete
MDLESDFRPFLALGVICLILSTISIIGGIEMAGDWMYTMYPIFILFAIAGFSISWIRWKNIDEKS